MFSKLVFTVSDDREITFSASELIIIAQEMVNQAASEEVFIPSGSEEIGRINHIEEKESLPKSLVIPQHIAQPKTIKQWLYLIHQLNMASTTESTDHLVKGLWIEIGDRLLYIKTQQDYQFYTKDCGFIAEIVKRTDILLTPNAISLQLADLNTYLKHIYTDLVSIVWKNYNPLSKAIKEDEILQHTQQCIGNSTGQHAEIKRYLMQCFVNNSLQILNHTDRNVREEARQLQRELREIIEDIENRVQNFQNGRCSHKIKKIKENNISEADSKLKICRKKIVWLTLGYLNKQASLGDKDMLFKSMATFGVKKEGAAYHEFAMELGYSGQDPDLNKGLCKWIRGLLAGWQMNDSNFDVLVSKLFSQYQCIPNLVAAWFVAEPARNPLSFLTGLMLLDLIESGIVLEEHGANWYTIYHTLIHPLKDKEGATIKDLYGKKVKDSDHFAGCHPMTHTGSVGDTKKLQVPLNVARQKEGHLIIHWLERMIATLPNDVSNLQFKVTADVQPVAPNDCDTTSYKEILDKKNKKIRKLKSTISVKRSKDKNADITKQNNAITKLEQETKILEKKIEIKTRIIEKLLGKRLSVLEKLLPGSVEAEMCKTNGSETVNIIAKLKAEIDELLLSGEVDNFFLRLCQKLIPDTADLAVSLGIDQVETKHYCEFFENHLSEGLKDLTLAKAEPEMSSRYFHNGTVLHAAIQTNNCKIFQLLLNIASIELLKHPDAKGNTIAHHIIFCKNAEMLKKLLDAGNPAEWIYLQNHEGDTVLHVAVKLKLNTIINKLAKLGGDYKDLLKIKNKKGKAVLDYEYAKTKDGKAILKQLNSRIMTPHEKKLFSCIEKNNLQLFRQDLLPQDRLTALNEYGNNLLMEAVYANRIELVNFLLTNDATKQLTHKGHKYCVALHFAAAENRAELIPVLLAKGAELEAVKEGDETPLMMAVAKGSYESVKELVKGGANIRAKSNEGYPLIHMSVKNLQKSNKAIIELLLEQDPSLLQDVNRWDRTLLHELCDSCREDQQHLAQPIMEDMLRLNPQAIDVVDNKKRTPLHLAARSGLLNLVNILLNNGADFNIQDADGCTAIDVAKNHKKYKVYQRLSQVPRRHTADNSRHGYFSSPLKQKGKQHSNYQHRSAAPMSTKFRNNKH